MKYPERIAPSIWTAQRGCLWSCLLFAVMLIAVSCVVTPAPTPQMPAFSLVELQTAIANLETAVPQLYATAEALSTIQAPVETLAARVDADIAVVDQAIATAQALQTRLAATPAFTAMPSPTASPTPVLCASCSYDGQCSSGYMCMECVPLGKICVRKTTPNGDCNNCRNRTALLSGAATYYDTDKHSFKHTRSGELYNPEAMACAVDDSLWHELKNKILLVCDEDNCIEVLVNDSGYLDEAGLFIWTTKRKGEYDVAWWYPASLGTPGAVQIVVDLTPRAYYALNPRGLVWVWLK